MTEGHNNIPESREKNKGLNISSKIQTHRDILIFRRRAGTFTEYVLPLQEVKDMSSRGHREEGGVLPMEHRTL